MEEPVGKTPVNDGVQMGSGTYKPQPQLLSSKREFKGSSSTSKTTQPLAALMEAGKMKFMDSIGYAVPKEICELFNILRKDSESFWTGL